LVTKYKGKDATAEVYKVDTVLLAEMRNHERQAAEELGPVGYKERIQYPQRGRDNRALERRPSPGAGSMGKRQLHAPAAARTTITAGTIALEISNRNARRPYRTAGDRERRLIHERGLEMADVPGGGFHRTYW
jgi:hypothetical protein